MIDPDRYIKTFADLGANILSVHYEACTHLQDVTGYKSRRNERGVAINPTPTLTS
jgi:ribulose-phosphate 3-epimerase